MTDHRGRPVRRVFAAALFCLLAACSGDTRAPGFPARPGPHEFSVMSYNLQRFGFMDRDGDGQEDNFKPEEEIEAMLTLIRAAHPDILAVQEIGDASAFQTLRERLQQAGLHYPHADYLPGNTRHANLGLLSRHPIAGRDALTNLTYSIRERALTVQRGFQQVDILVRPNLSVRIIHAHLKTKSFHQAGQTEMRRNEARLLATHVRRVQREQPDRPLLVCGDFSDTETSAALRELIGSGVSVLRDLPLADHYGDRWTYFSRRESGYFRTSYMMVNDALYARWQEDKSGIVRDQRAGAASDHRPIIAVFSTKDPRPAPRAAGNSGSH